MDFTISVHADHVSITLKIDGSWVRLPLEARLRFHEAISGARAWLQAFLANETEA